MNKQQAKEFAKTVAQTDAMEKFRIGDEDLTPVIQATRFGFEAGVEFAAERAQIEKALIERFMARTEFRLKCNMCDTDISIVGISTFSSVAEYAVSLEWGFEKDQVLCQLCTDGKR